MERRPDARATLRGVRVFLVQMNGYEPLTIMLRAFGADVHDFASLHEAQVATVPAGMTVLVARLAVADDEHDADPVTFVVSGFGVPGILRPAPVRPSFAERFVEVHRGHPEVSSLCASIIRAAGPSHGRALPQQANGPGLRIAI